MKKILFLFLILPIFQSFSSYTLNDKSIAYAWKNNAAALEEGILELTLVDGGLRLNFPLLPKATVLNVNILFKGSDSNDIMLSIKNVLYRIINKKQKDMLQTFRAPIPANTNHITLYGLGVRDALSCEIIVTVEKEEDDLPNISIAPTDYDGNIEKKCAALTDIITDKLKAPETFKMVSQMCHKYCEMHCLSKDYLSLIQSYERLLSFLNTELDRNPEDLTYINLLQCHYPQDLLTSWQTLLITQKQKVNLEANLLPLIKKIFKNDGPRHGFIYEDFYNALQITGDDQNKIFFALNYIYNCLMLAENTPSILDLCKETIIDVLSDQEENATFASVFEDMAFKFGHSPAGEIEQIWLYYRESAEKMHEDYQKMMHKIEIFYYNPQTLPLYKMLIRMLIAEELVMREGQTCQNLKDNLRSLQLEIQEISL